MRRWTRPLGTAAVVAAILLVVLPPGSAWASPSTVGLPRTYPPGTGPTEVRPSTQAPTWTNVTSVADGAGIGPPDVGIGAIATYDASAGSAVAYGGSSVSGVAYADLWDFRGGAWSQGPSATGPTPNGVVEGAMTYDPHLGGELEFGGAINATGSTGWQSNATWLLKNGSWTNLTTSGPRPSARTGEVLVYDVADGYDVLFGGANRGAMVFNDTWEFANGSWRNVTNSSGSPGVYCCEASDYDAAEGGVLLAAGIGNPLGGSDVTWLFKGGRWTELNPSKEPSDRQWDTMAFDPITNESVLFGGTNYGATDPRGTWVFENGSWTQLSPVPSPRLRDGAVMWFDPSARGVVLFGGYSGDIGLQLSDTWIFAAPPSFNVTIASAPSALEVGEPGQFTAGSVGNGTAISGCRWSFGDGATAVGPNVSHRFGRAANFTVAVDCTDAYNLSANASTLVRVEPAVTLAISSTPSDVEVNVTVTVEAHPSGGFGPYAVAWAAANRSLPPGDEVKLTWNAPGTYAVDGQVTDAHGMSASATTMVAVGPGLRVRTNDLPNATDVGLPVAFNASSTGGVAPVRFDWTFGDGASSATARANHTYGVPGTDHPTVVAEDADGINVSATFTLRLDPLPSVRILPGAPGADSGVPFNASAIVSGGTGPDRIGWSIDGGPIASGGSFSDRFLVPGPVRLEASAVDVVGGNGSAELVVPVAPFPTVGIAPGAGAIAGVPYAFGLDSTGGTAPFQERWSFGDGASGSGPAPSHTFAVAGRFLVRLQFADAAGAHLDIDSYVTVASAAPPVSAPSAPPPAPPADVVLVLAGATAAVAGLVGLVGVARRRRRSRREAPEGNDTGSVGSPAPDVPP